MKTTADDATGRWRSLLASVGFPEEVLRNRHGPCPLGCDGKKSFRFDDRGGKGTWICTHCGSGDGFHLVANWLGISVPEAMNKVDTLLPKAVASAIPAPKNNANVRDRMRKLWRDSVPVEGTPSGEYLARRTGRLYASSAIRHHASVPYWATDDKPVYLGDFPCMLALVRDAAGQPIGIHRTYLKRVGIGKAEVPEPKKLATWAPVSGGAIRIDPLDGGILGLAEGIETAIAASMRFGFNVWAAISTSGMITFEPPAEVRTVIVFADNDLNFAGQLAAYTLANRLVLKNKLKASVVTPSTPGSDWADEEAS